VFGVSARSRMDAVRQLQLGNSTVPQRAGPSRCRRSGTPCRRPRRPATSAGSKASIASFRCRPSSNAPRRLAARLAASAVAAALPGASDGATPARRRRAPGSPAVAEPGRRAARRTPRPTARAPAVSRGGRRSPHVYSREPIHGSKTMKPGTACASRLSKRQFGPVAR
jgi:hypothetical protein